MADLKFGDREYRKVDGIWMMHPSTLPGFIAVAEESTSAMLDEIERLRAERDAERDRSCVSTADAILAMSEMEAIRKFIQCRYRNYPEDADVRIPMRLDNLPESVIDWVLDDEESYE